MANALGKRKEREEDSETKQHGSTLFVSNLPYSATSTDLNTLFSDIGPVRSAFVVLDQDKKVSKGVGYVSFAIREDAQLASERVNSGEGLVLDSRRLRVEWAGSKPHKDHTSKDTEPKIKSEDGPKPARPAHPTGPKDPLAIKTIVVSGLPSSIDSKTLWKKVRKYTGAEKVEWPIKANNQEDPSTAHVVFDTAAHAQDAVTKLHAHVFKGALLSVTLKKRLDTLAKPKPVKLSQTAKGIPEAGPSKPSTASSPTKSSQNIAPSRANRLIVRNLPFDITEQDLRVLFLPYGPIHSIDIPLNEPEVKAEGQSTLPPKPKGKGYAFIWYLSKPDATRAIESANGKKVKAGLASTLVSDKQKRKKLRREEAKIAAKQAERTKARLAAGKSAEDDDEPAEGEDADKEGASSDEGGQSETEEHTEGVERVIAVDWALSKNKWEEVKAKMAEADDGSASESDDASEGSESEGEDSHIGVHEGGEDESGSEPSESSDEDGDDMDVDEDANPGKPVLPPPEEGTTLFVRNVPFEATEDELRVLFRAFGPLRYARITLYHDTGRSRGTGFVCFWNKEDADKVIEQADILRQETSGPSGTAAAEKKKNPFAMPNKSSLLTMDPSAPLAQALVLHARTLDVVRAVPREEASKLKEEGERRREKGDKRNTYLLREGVILPSSPAASSLSSSELEKRTASFNARRALLKSNPSLYVSRTRLSVRQLPLFVTERIMRRMANWAVKAFEDEVKAGKREPLTPDELLEPLPEDEDAEEKPKEKKARGKGNRKPPLVKQSKIVRQQDRVDPITGKGRSKGYGFLELSTHADALRVLRWANNNPEFHKLFSEWWKEDLGEMVKEAVKKVKGGKGKESREADGKEKEEAGMRLERLKKELASFEESDGKVKVKEGKGTLIVEFSIENVQVVKRRQAHQAEQKEHPAPPGRKSTGPGRASVKNETEDIEPQARHGRKEGPERKKRRLSESQKPSSKMQERPDKTSDKKVGNDSEDKPQSPQKGNSMGSLIGRKRKERKARKKA